MLDQKEGIVVSAHIEGTDGSELLAPWRRRLQKKKERLKSGVAGLRSSGEAEEAVNRSVVEVGFGGSSRRCVSSPELTFFIGISRELFDMDSATKRLEKQVGEANREIAGLNERFGGLEQILSTVKELMTEIKEALSQREEREKSPLVQSLNKASPVQMANTIGSDGVAEKMVRDWPDARRRNQRLGMPVFSGGDPCGWIFKAERYFKLYGVEEREKVDYATLHMKGEALNWVMFMKVRYPIHGWEMFKHELLRRFQTTKIVSAYEQLLSLKQSTTVAHYREQFELLSAPFIRDMSEETITFAFINGLNDDVKDALKSIEPKDLAHSDDSYDELEQENPEDETNEEWEQETVVGEIQSPLSINSTVSNNSAAFKFLGKIGSKEVIVKIGSGATHNFISKKVVAELQIPVERTRSFRVNCGILPKAEGTGVCKNVVLKAQDIEIVTRFFPTELGVADVVLGGEWLKSVGKFLFQAKPLAMTFEWQGRTVTLRSDPSLTKGIELGVMILEWDEEN